MTVIVTASLLSQNSELDDHVDHVDHPPLARQAHADPHPRKQLENRHGWRLTIQTDGYVRGQTGGDP